jgi:hypothetical protein
MDMSAMEDNRLSQYLAITMLPRQANSSLNAWPWMSRIVLLIETTSHPEKRWGRSWVEDYIGLGELSVHSVQCLYQL